MAYGARLESALSESSRGFESPILRQIQASYLKSRMKFMFDRIQGLRPLVLGEPGSDLQKDLNRLVLAGHKTGTSSIDDGEYAEEQEDYETVGEQNWLVDGQGEPIALVEYTAVEWVPFKDVTWDFVVSEGEGFTSVEHWQEVHHAFWSECGITVTPETEVICYSFKVLEELPRANPPE